jgi:hypothetical protein
LPRSAQRANDEAGRDALGSLQGQRALAAE